MSDKCTHDSKFFPNGTCLICMSIMAERAIERARCAQLIDELASSWNEQKPGYSRPEDWSTKILEGVDPKHPLGMTLGNMENQQEFWICNHCFNDAHDQCTGLAFDSDLRETFSCECEVKVQHTKRNEQKA